jgi:MFS family permease
MTPRQLKAGYFGLEGINAFATAFYFNYLFFFMQSRYDYGNFENLALSATNGFIYAAAAWWGGRFAQRFGYFLALRLGVGIMIVTLTLGSSVTSAAGHWLIMGAWTIGMCFTWPTLEALVSEGESYRTLPRAIGIYNLTWAGASAFAYFTGGALLEHFGPRSLFLVPAALHLLQFAWISRLAAAAQKTHPHRHVPAPEPSGSRTGRFAPARTKVFLRMAWIANPFAYVAITTIIAVIPSLAKRHELSPTWAGIFCSIWLFARFLTFALLWQWPHWHYRFRWFITAYLLLFLGFVAMLIAPALWIVLLAQLLFGGAVGLVYYSSLFYSMDVSETKGVHGGIHEAAIGVGIFGGPAVGALGLYVFPAYATAGVWAVAGLLFLGLCSILRIQSRAHRLNQSQPIPTPTATT